MPPNRPSFRHRRRRPRNNEEPDSQIPPTLTSGEQQVVAEEEICEDFSLASGIPATKALDQSVEKLAESKATEDASKTSTLGGAVEEMQLLEGESSSQNAELPASPIQPTPTPTTQANNPLFIDGVNDTPPKLQIREGVSTPQKDSEKPTTITAENTLPKAPSKALQHPTTTTLSKKFRRFQSDKKNKIKFVMPYRQESTNSSFDGNNAAVKRIVARRKPKASKTKQKLFEMIGTTQEEIKIEELQHRITELEMSEMKLKSRITEMEHKISQSDGHFTHLATDINSIVTRLDELEDRSARMDKSLTTLTSKRAREKAAVQDREGSVIWEATKVLGTAASVSTMVGLTYWFLFVKD
ncbi:hypothetical protein H072_2435 [Dactylellina haptotyla CBS 200.50]|uniref:Uncharacterized protein n=1 Tax=Dactylellina haptotyla (strain CBS 200.50) TaxID=1284197 RepID=S8AR56_DACHA|nr:hypothetical protein H072_2435 [Dactylellina haptotyla CBS 200.50]